MEERQPAFLIAGRRKGVERRKETTIPSATQ
jgi:hypothetical protein